MPQRKCALKAMRSDKKKRLHNLKIKSNIKNLIKSFQKAVISKQFEEAKKILPRVISSLDKAAKKRVIHLNTARRRISRLASKLNQK